MNSLNQHGGTRLGGDMDAREHLSDVAIYLAEHLRALYPGVNQHPLMDAASGEVLSRVGHSWIHGQADPDEPSCPWTPEQAYLLAWGEDD